MDKPVILLAMTLMRKHNDLLLPTGTPSGNPMKEMGKVRGEMLPKTVDDTYTFEREQYEKLVVEQKSNLARYICIREIRQGAALLGQPLSLP